jgi:hypothetical protein
MSILSPQRGYAIGSSQEIGAKDSDCETTRPIVAMFNGQGKLRGYVILSGDMPRRIFPVEGGVYLEQNGKLICWEPKHPREAR